MLVAIATRPDSMNRAGEPFTVHAFPRPTVIGTADAPRPIPKAIKRISLLEWPISPPPPPPPVASNRNDTEAGG